MATKLQIRHDSTENWLSVNPVLEMAEPGYETTTNRLKLGDGLTAWNDLPYLKGETYDDTDIKQEISEINTKLETKANSVDVYTKTEIENLNYVDTDELASKNYMAKEEALEQFNTKTEITEMLENYVPVTRTINSKTLNANIVLTASDVNALPDTTVVPTKTSELDNDMGFLSAVPAEYVTETELKARGYATTNDVNDMLDAKADKDSLATVATSGSYNDLEDKPTIPSEYTLPIASSSVLGGIKVGSGLAISEDGTLSSTSSGGTTDYTALSNKPQINGIELSGNKTLAELGIQAAGDYLVQSDLSNYVQSSSLSTVATSGSYNDLSNKPTIPTNTSDLTNDSGFITSIPAEYVTETELSSELDNYVTSETLTSGLSTKADKSTTLSGYGITDAYTKTEIDNQLAGAFHYKGSVANEAALPQDNNKQGDVYNVEDTGANYAWNGTSWDKLSETIDLTPYLTKSEASTTYATKTELSANYATKTELSAKADSSSIPTNTSDLTNDSGFITETDLDGYVTSTTFTQQLNLKADKSELGNYTTTETLNGLLDDKADKSELNDYATTESLSAYATTSSLTSGLSTKADKSTTLSGYGITDAYTKTEIDDYLDDKANIADLSTVATSGSYNDLENKPVIPSEYILPIDTTLGGVKVDGTTITATEEGVITAASATKGANFYIYGNSSVPDISPSASTTIPVSRFQNYDVNNSKLQLGDVLIDLEGTIAYVTNLNSGPSNPNMWTFNVTDDSIVIKLQTRNDENLTTTDKTIVGAINELLTKINALDARITALETPTA